MGLFFFFSSRRRHTRCGRDWSSDVCSSDLHAIAEHEPGASVTNDVVDRRCGESVIDRHRHEAGANDAVNGSEIFEAIGREDGDAVAARKSVGSKRPGYRIGLTFEIAVVEAALLIRSEIDDRDLVAVAVWWRQCAEVVK